MRSDVCCIAYATNVVDNTNAETSDVGKFSRSECPASASWSDQYEGLQSGALTDLYRWRGQTEPGQLAIDPKSIEPAYVPDQDYIQGEHPANEWDQGQSELEVNTANQYPNTYLSGQVGSSPSSTGGGTNYFGEGSMNTQPSDIIGPQETGSIPPSSGVSTIPPHDDDLNGSVLPPP